MEWRAGTNIFGHFGGMVGGTVRIFLSLWLCSGGYGTVDVVRGGWSVFSLLSLVCCQFSWRLDVCGRNFGYIFVGSFVVFFRGFLFYKVLIVNNLLQVVSQESAP